MHAIGRAIDGKLGSELTPEEQKYVLSAYVHRYTRDHVPVWAHMQTMLGEGYKVQFASDADWLARTRFAVTKYGKLDKRVGECYSTPTWPDNPELRR